MEQLADIVAHLEPALGPASGAPRPLQGGITNRNFRATFAGEGYVIRLHGKDTALLGIDRDAERQANEAAARLGIAPEVVATFPAGLVTRFVSCDGFQAGELATRAEELARALRAFHGSGVLLRARFWVPDLLGAYARIVRERGGRLPPSYDETVAVAARIVAALPPHADSPCHNDLLPGNVIRAHGDDRLMLVDWEYAAMGHPYFDLGNLSVNNEFDAAADELLLAVYNGRAPSDGERAALKLMRVLSDAREAAWGVVQSRISELEFDFDAYGDAHFERLLAAAASPDFEEWLAAA